MHVHACVFVCNTTEQDIPALTQSDTSNTPPNFHILLLKNLVKSTLTANTKSQE